jgi:hypothetical protein
MQHPYSSRIVLHKNQITAKADTSVIVANPATATDAKNSIRKSKTLSTAHLLVMGKE